MTESEAIERLKWCNSYQRMPELLAMVDELPDQIWLQLLGEEWSGCDNVGRFVDELWETPLCCVERPVRAMMSQKEWDVMQTQPSEIDIYRGCFKINQQGLSWSLDKAVAERFPSLNRYWIPEETALLIHARIPSSEAIALKLEREEVEVIATPTAEQIMSITELEITRGN